MSKFKVGDTVYNIRKGVCVVINTCDGSEYPLKVRRLGSEHYSSFNEDGFTEDGRWGSKDVNPTLLTIDEARAKGYDVPKVKRKVTKTISRWANVYPDEHLIACNDYHTREEADSNANLSKRIACVELTGTYEVEEEV